MNRKKRKAYKMFRRRLGKATNIFWRSLGPQGQAAFTAEATASLRVLFRQCAGGGSND